MDKVKKLEHHRRCIVTAHDLPGRKKVVMEVDTDTVWLALHGEKSKQDIIYLRYMAATGYTFPRKWGAHQGGVSLTISSDQTVHELIHRTSRFKPRTAAQGRLAPAQS